MTTQQALRIIIILKTATQMANFVQEMFKGILSSFKSPLEMQMRSLSTGRSLELQGSCLLCLGTDPLPQGETGFHPHRWACFFTFNPLACIPNFDSVTPESLGPLSSVYPPLVLYPGNSRLPFCSSPSSTAYPSRSAGCQRWTARRCRQSRRSLPFC